MDKNNPQFTRRDIDTTTHPTLGMEPRAEYEGRDIDQVQPGDRGVAQPVSSEPALDIDQVQPGEDPGAGTAEPARDIDQVQPDDYGRTGTAPLTDDLNTGDPNTQPRMPIDRTQTTRPLDPGSKETRVLGERPGPINDSDMTPYVPTDDDVTG